MPSPWMPDGWPTRTSRSRTGGRCGRAWAKNPRSRRCGRKTGLGRPSPVPPVVPRWPRRSSRALRACPSRNGAARRYPASGGSVATSAAAGRGKAKPAVRIGGTLLYETQRPLACAAAGERHQIVESPVAGIVREARNSVEVTIEVAGAAIPGAIAAGEPSRGYLDVPRLTDGELWASALDVGPCRRGGRGRQPHLGPGDQPGPGDVDSRPRSPDRSARASCATSRPRSSGRRRAWHHPCRSGSSPSTATSAGPSPRPSSPCWRLCPAAKWRSSPIRRCSSSTRSEVPLPELPPDWVRVRSGPHAGREGRWLGSAGSTASAPGSTSRPRSSGSATKRTPRSCPSPIWSASSSESSGTLAPEPAISDDPASAALIEFASGRYRRLDRAGAAWAARDSVPCRTVGDHLVGCRWHRRARKQEGVCRHLGRDLSRRNPLSGNLAG